MFKTWTCNFITANLEHLLFRQQELLVLTQFSGYAYHMCDGINTLAEYDIGTYWHLIRRKGGACIRGCIQYCRLKIPATKLNTVYLKGKHQLEVTKESS